MFWWKYNFKKKDTCENCVCVCAFEPYLYLSSINNIFISLTMLGSKQQYAGSVFLLCLSLQSGFGINRITLHWEFQLLCRISPLHYKKCSPDTFMTPVTGIEPFQSLLTHTHMRPCVEFAFKER